MEEEVEVQDELMDLSIVKKELAGDASTLEDSVDDERESLEELHPLDAVEAELAIKEEDEDCRDLSFDENVEKYMEASTSGGAMRCCFCNRGFRQKFMLKRHLSIHMDNRPSFSCEFCGNSYTWIDSLRRHLQKCKKNANTLAQYRCTTCWRSFNQEIYLLEHQKDCSGQRGTPSNSLNINTTPDDAHDETTAFADVAGDAASRNDGKLDLFECGICYKKFKNKDFFEKHQGIHTLLQTPHNCNTCGNTYKYRGSLVRHQLMCEIMEEPTIPYTCPNCGNTFNQVLTLTQHRKVCGQQPMSQKQQEEGPSKPPDVEENTTKGVNEEKMNPGDVKKATRRVFSCQICGNTYRHSHSMKRHQRMCKEMGDTAKFSCSICGNKFHERISMIQHWRVCRGHVKKVSGIVKQKPGVKMMRVRTRKVGLFPCGTCGRTYTWESNLRRHQKTCTKDVKPPEKPMENLLRFSCQKCGSMFNEQSMLDTHAKICSSNVPMDVMKELNEDFAVTTATKTATTAANARVEEQRPRLKKQILYSCRICGNAYKHRGSRFRHQKECELKAGKQQLTCLTCGNKFRDVSALEVHRNSCRAVTKNPQKPEMLTGSENQGEKRLKPSRKGVFSCENCGKIYAWKFTLQRHQRKCCKNGATSTQTLPKLSPKKEDKKEAILSVKSEIEATTATTEDQLKQEGKPKDAIATASSSGYSCKNCGNVYKHSTSMIRHQRICEALGIRPQISCSGCGNKFHNQFSLLQHKKACGGSDTVPVIEKKKIVLGTGIIRKRRFVRKKGSHSCGNCGNVYQWKYTMQRHQMKCEKRHGKPEFSCESCGNKFYQKNSLMGHINKCPKRQEPENREEKEAGGNTGGMAENNEGEQEDIKKGKEKQNKVKGKKGSKKEEKEENIQDFREHQKPKTMTCSDGLPLKQLTPHSCNSCGNSYKHSSSLYRHYSSCKGKVEAAPTLSCTKCGNEFHEEASFVEHVKKCGEQSEQVLGSSSNVQKPTKEDEKSKKDDQMEVSSEIENQKNLTETLSTSPQYVCIICENNFNGKISFDAHIDECRKLFWDTKDDSSEESDEQPDPPEEIKIFECSICSMSFKSKTDMMDHAVTHMKNKPRHTCKLCGNTYAWKRNLLKHMEQCEKIPQKSPISGSSSANAGSQMLKCPFCTKKFKQEINLKKHLVKHETDKNTRYACKYCGNKYRHNASLHRHQNSCKGGNSSPKEICRFCGNKFHDRFSLLQHWKVCDFKIKGPASEKLNMSKKSLGGRSKKDSQMNEEEAFDAFFANQTSDTNDEEIDMTEPLEDQCMDSQANDMANVDQQSTNGQFMVKIEEEVVQRNHLKA